jgi:hypothetical protein
MAFITAGVIAPPGRSCSSSSILPARLLGHFFEGLDKIIADARALGV